MKEFFMEESGQGMVEHGLIVALVSTAVMTALKLISNNLAALFDFDGSGVAGVSNEIWKDI